MSGEPRSARCSDSSGTKKQNLNAPDTPLAREDLPVLTNHVVTVSTPDVEAIYTMGTEDERLSGQWLPLRDAEGVWA